jgi:hypothetical protein
VGQTVRFQEILRRLAMIDEAFVEDRAALGLDPAGPAALDPKTAALLRVGACVATGPPGVCLEWSTGRALAAAFEIICCDCDDHPGLDDVAVSPELQRIRGRYPIEAGGGADENHLGLHQEPEVAHRTETMTDAG